MQKYLPLVVTIFLLPINVIAQLTGKLNASPITQTEYFFNTDPGFGNGTPIIINQSTNVDILEFIPTDGLVPGSHTITIRAQNADGTWGIGETRPFVVLKKTQQSTPSPIIRLEYFIDVDPGYGNGLTIPIEQALTFDFTTNIPTDSLAPGSHIITIRAQNTDGTWGIGETRPFVVLKKMQQSTPSPIVRLEYFIDVDPGYGSGLTIPVEQALTFDFTTDIPTDSLELGSHTITVRAQNANGVWGMGETRRFQVIQGPPPTPTPRLRLTNTSMDFGEVVQGQSHTLTLPISNTGDATLSITSITANNPQFSSQTQTLTIPADSSGTIEITYSPTSTGAQTATLSLNSNASTTPATVTLQGIGLSSPTLEVSTATIDFGDLDVGVTKDTTITISNTGNGTLSGRIRSSSSILKATPDTFSVGAGASENVRLRIAPTAEGTIDTKVEIISTGGSKNIAITARARSNTPRLAILPTIINFGQASLGQSKTLSLRVTNEGGGTLDVINAVTSSADFVVSETFFSLTAGESKILSITFLPSQLGTVNQTLDLPSNDPLRPFLQIPLRATVRSGSGTPSLSTPINVLEFGETGPTGTAELNLPIRNEGSAELNIFNVVSSDLQVAVSPRSLRVAPQQTRVLTVRFRPRPGRARQGEIVINSDDPNQPAFRISWEATVAVAERLLSVVSTTPTSEAVSISLETELIVTFDEPILTNGRFIALNARLLPQPTSGVLLDNFQVSTDGREVRFPVVLQPDTFYRWIITDASGQDGARQAEAFEVGFSTGSAPVVIGSIAGNVSFDDGRAFEGSAILFDTKGNLVAKEAIDEAGRYQIQNLPPDTYQIFAEVFAEGAGSVSGGYDADADGQADAITLAAGQDLQQINLQLKSPITETSDTTETPPPPPVNQGASVVIDLDSSEGNQAMATQTGVSANDDIVVSVYGSNTTDLIGYSLTVSYDTTQVTFKRVEEQASTDEKSLLFSNGGSAVFIVTPPNDGQVGIAGAILGATEQTTPSGDGLLAVFRFVATDALTSTTFNVTQTIFQSGTVQDTVAVPSGAIASSETSQLPDTGTPSDPGEEIPGPLLIDLNSADENQNLTTQTGVSQGARITLQIFASDFPEVIGAGFNIEFDSKALAYVEGSFQISSFIPGATPLITDKGGILDAGVASLGGGTGSGTGLFATLNFDVQETFADSTYIAITNLAFTLANGGLQDQPIRVLARLKSEREGLPGDFDGDGSVGFRDFLGFAGAFGGSDPTYDIDGDGTVGFRDFLTFAGVFGQSSG